MVNVFNASMQLFVFTLASDSVEGCDTVVSARNQCRIVRYGPIAKTPDVEQLVFDRHGHLDDVVQLSPQLVLSRYLANLLNCVSEAVLGPAASLMISFILQVWPVKKVTGSSN